MNDRKNMSRMSGKQVVQAVKTSIVRLHPLHQIRNPIMFLVYCCAILMTVDWIDYAHADHRDPQTFILIVSLTLWATVIFANFAEAYAEERERAQAEELQASRPSLMAKRLRKLSDLRLWDLIPSRRLQKRDLVIVHAGDFIPADGLVIDGIATVDESAITGESAAVIREATEDGKDVVAGSRVLSDWIVIKVKAVPGETYLDRLLGLAMAARRKKVPSEVALGLFLVASAIATLASCMALLPLSAFSAEITQSGAPITLGSLIALVVCLAPTTIGGLLTPISIAGMNRLLKRRVVATEARAIDAASDVRVVLIDKTGTITLGNRQANRFYPAQGVAPQTLAEAAYLSSYADKTPEGRSIVDLCTKSYDVMKKCPLGQVTFIPFTAEKRISGVTIGSRAILKGALDSIEDYVTKLGGRIPDDIAAKTNEIARLGSTPLIVAEGPKVLGLIELKDIIKPGIREKLGLLRKMGLQSVMVTGDNPMTAATLASEAGVDDFIAQATPDIKLARIRELQERGELVAMVGDGTNDAPALAQADLGLSMRNGTHEAVEAGNMVDLDSDPTKLIDVILVAREQMVTRGSLTTFSIASDIAKYLVVTPLAFVYTNPALSGLNYLGLSSPHNALLAALVFNALLIPAMIPAAMRGVRFRTSDSQALLGHNLLVYGLGGASVTLIGIKLIDSLLFLFTGA